MAMKPSMQFGNLRLTSDPEVNTKVTSGTLVAVSVAFNEKYKKKDGTPVEIVHFYELEFWSHKAVYLMKYGHKGAAIEARCFPRMSSWENEEGKKRSRIVFRVEDFSFVSTKTMGSTDKKPQGEAGMGQTAPPPDDDIPF